MNYLISCMQSAHCLTPYLFQEFTFLHVSISNSCSCFIFHPISWNSWAIHHRNCFFFFLLPVIAAVPPVLSFQPKLHLFEKLTSACTLKLMPSTSIYFTSEGQFCCIQSNQRLQPEIIRGISNKASLQRNPWPVRTLSAPLPVLGKHTSLRCYQRCQLAFTPGFLLTLRAYMLHLLLQSYVSWL